MSANYSMAFPVSTWTQGGELSFNCKSLEKMDVFWNIKSFIHECQGGRKELSSEDFSFADSVWNLFVSLEGNEGDTLFGISVREHRPSDAVVVDCYCDIYFLDLYSLVLFKNIKYNLKCESADSQCSVGNFLSKSELEKILQRGFEILCCIEVKKTCKKEACSRAENADSCGANILIPYFDKDNEIPKLSAVYKMCHDFKQLFLSEEGSDVTLQVQDHQFKAHRYILSARSSVFAAMFRHDMKEKATGVVDVEDCEPSSFPVLLEFMYCCSTENISVENVFNLYTSADKYDVHNLKIECLEFIKNNLSTETFCQTVRLALLHPETNLLELVIEFFARNMKEIIITAKWQAFLAENYIQCNEILIKALAHWKFQP